ncbi:MAG TPA: hypothetical protein VKA65_16755 [Acidimicrobiales bacterium]|nr:hypothetical protein [Acidimicrobiales bacterium]
MTDDVTDDDSTKGPLEQAIDMLVYAPIGLFFSGPSLLPQLVEEGRNQAKAGRMFGEFAVRQGRAELERRLAAFEEKAGETLRILGVRGDDDIARPPGPTGTGTSSATAAGSTAAGSSASGGVGVGPNGASARSAATASSIEGTAPTSVGGNGLVTPIPTPSPTVEDLAITGYDSLSASQVVTRLDGLGTDELEAVRAYEIAHRGRKTILNKVAQLQT